MSRGGPAEVSVVIPTRDREDWLPRTLLTALAQRGVRTDVIVVDDGSASPVAERLTDVARSKVTVIRNDLPAGVAAARNRGLEAASSDWLAFLDDDDLWAPTKLSRLLELAKSSGAGLAFSGGVSIDDEGDPIDAWEPPPEQADLHRALLAANVIQWTCSNVIARTELVRSVGGFDERLIHVADWDLLIRLSEVAPAIATKDRLIAYTLHDENMHLTDLMVREDLRLLKEKHESRRSELGVEFDRASWLTWRSSADQRAGRYRRSAVASLELAWRRRRPALMARSLALMVGGGWAIAARRRLRRPGPRAEAYPDWLSQAARPAPEAIAAVWR